MLISLGTHTVQLEGDEISPSVRPGWLSAGSSVWPDLKYTRDVLNVFCASPHLSLGALQDRFLPEESRPREPRPTLSTCLCCLPVCLQDSSQSSTRSPPRAAFSRQGQELVDWRASWRHVPHDFPGGPPVTWSFIQSPTLSPAQ